MDIISLYEKNKPYQPQIEQALKRTHQSLQDKKYLSYVSLGGLTLISGIIAYRSGKIRETIKVVGLGIAGAGLIELQNFNLYLGKLYIAQKIKPKYENA